jgi:hypothetical protein
MTIQYQAMEMKGVHCANRKKVFYQTVILFIFGSTDPSPFEFSVHSAANAKAVHRTVYILHFGSFDNDASKYHVPVFRLPAFVAINVIEHFIILIG